MKTESAESTMLAPAGSDEIKTTAPWIKCCMNYENSAIGRV